MTDRLSPLLAERPWLLADGATGSNLFDRGLLSGDAPELWNSDHPERIADLHRLFIQAGADIIRMRHPKAIATARRVIDDLTS